ncbi:MAG: bifunctional histidinol-phosphatase/imidazoleglycerol-phosphate dehydratase HisB [Bacteroidetes bacterium]|nr:bifunctional histidinol-phosphatase/imidazoleglycerol-phosphate dehydratase HisB [Bacteroidota bacterium]
MKKVLFIDRDGTIIVEPPITFQIDSLEKLEFLPYAISSLRKFAEEMDFELVMVSNQDGLGTKKYPKKSYDAVQKKLLRTLSNEGIEFDDILIDKSFDHQNSPNRKPRTGMMKKYLYGNYDLKNSFVIGDRITDLQLAKNLGTKAILVRNDLNKRMKVPAEFQNVLVCDAKSWNEIYNFFQASSRKISHSRKTKETDIKIEINLDGKGKSKISTGLSFFDHMLEQIAKHGGIDLKISAKGDLHIDEHHTIEDVGIALGEAFSKALGDKCGIERYGFCLPMDDCLAQVALDFGGRNWIEWNAEFKREKIGEISTEMFFHFFKSFSDSAKCNLNIKAEGTNEHHKIEAIFKAFAKAIKMAVKRDANNMTLPSTKGML